MKYFTPIYTLVFLFASVSCNTENPVTQENLIADSNLELEIEGMVCEFGCAKFIEKEVSKLPGVTQCDVNFEKGLAKISFSSIELGSEEIIKVIEKINDGQYKATKHEEKTEIPESSNVKKKSEKPSYDQVKAAFRFPELITYFMRKLIR